MFTVSGFSILSLISSHEKKMASIPSGFPFKRRNWQCEGIRVCNLFVFDQESNRVPLLVKKRV